jgi:hypothetical protein
VGIDSEDEIEGFAVGLARMPRVARWAWAVLCALGGALCLVSGRLLVLTDGWGAWAVTLVVLEPLGLLAVLGAGILAQPRSKLSSYLSRTLARRRYGSAAFVVVSLAAIFEVVRWCMRSLLLSHPR